MAEVKEEHKNSTGTGVYCFVRDLIVEGKDARFVDDNGRFALNWLTTPRSYADYKGKDGSKLVPKIARNNLRSALLNSYEKEGAKEYKESEKKNARGKICEKQFQMPPRIAKQLFGIDVLLSDDDNERETDSAASDLEACKSSEETPDSSDTGFEEMDISCDDYLVSSSFPSVDIPTDFSDHLPLDDTASEDSVPSDILTPFKMFGIPEEELKEPLDRLCLSYNNEQQGVVQGIFPLASSIEGGLRCIIMLLEGTLPANDDASYVGVFDGIAVVPLRKVNCSTLEGIIPSAQKPCTVKVFVQTLNGQLLGITSFRYVVKATQEALEQLVHDPALWTLFFTLWCQRSNIAQPQGSSSMQGQGSQIQTKNTQALKVLQLLVYTAAQTDAQQFIKMIFNTSSAGKIIFNSYKDRTPLPEDVARANGHDELAQYLQDVSIRLSREDSDDSQSNTVDWLELVTAVNKIQKQSYVPEVETDSESGQTEDDDDQSDYFADVETSSCGSYELDVGWSDSDVDDGENLPVRWKAPEVLGEQSYSTPSDDYSFGMPFEELLTYGRRKERFTREDDNYETEDRTDPNARAEGQQRAQEDNDRRMQQLRDEMERDRQQTLRDAPTRVNIALLGQISYGKSRILGALLRAGETQSTFEQGTGKEGTIRLEEYYKKKIRMLDTPGFFESDDRLIDGRLKIISGRFRPGKGIVRNRLARGTRDLFKSVHANDPSLREGKDKDGLQKIRDLLTHDGCGPVTFTTHDDKLNDKESKDQEIGGDNGKIIFACESSRRQSVDEDGKHDERNRAKSIHEVVFTNFVTECLRADGLPVPQELSENDQRINKDVAHALRDIGDSLSNDTSLNSLLSQLVVTKDTPYDSFFQVAEQIFQDGVINWGRIVTLFCFGYKLALQVINQIPLIKMIIQWVVQFIEDRLAKWIFERGGWEFLLGLVTDTPYSKPAQGEPGKIDTVSRVVHLASEWSSAKGGLSTINRELAISLAKQKEVKVTLPVPPFACCKEGISLNLIIKEPKRRPGYEPLDCLRFPPTSQFIRESQNSVQEEHPATEELGKNKNYFKFNAKGEENRTEVDPNPVVRNLTEAFPSYLHLCEEHQDVIQLTPGILDSADQRQARKENDKFKVLTFRRGDPEDFSLKGFDIAAKALAVLNDTRCFLIFFGAPEVKQDEVEDNSRDLTARKCFTKDDKELFSLPSGKPHVVEYAEPEAWAKASRAVRLRERAERLEEVQRLQTCYGEKYNREKQSDVDNFLLGQRKVSKDCTTREKQNRSKHEQKRRKARPSSSKLSVILKREPKLVVVDELALCLDRETRTIQNWKHLASELKVDEDVTVRLEQYSDFSPTTRLFEYLTVTQPEMSIQQLKQALIDIRRNDLFSFLTNKDSLYVSKSSPSKELAEDLSLCLVTDTPHRKSAQDKSDRIYTVLRGLSTKRRQLTHKQVEVTLPVPLFAFVHHKNTSEDVGNTSEEESREEDPRSTMLTLDRSGVAYQTLTCVLDEGNESGEFCKSHNKINAAKKRNANNQGI